MFEGYRLKYRLNAIHRFSSVDVNIHPHTFEISLYIEQTQARALILFSTIDTIIDKFLLRYKNQYLNDIPPFNKLEPTIENMGNVFFDNLKVILFKENLNLLQLEISETPLRLYYVSDRLMFGSLNQTSNYKSLEQLIKLT